MQSNFIDDRHDNFSEIPTSNSMVLTYNEAAQQSKEFIFQANFIGSMDMFSNIDTVANYLNAHQGWFCRCARPMKVEPLGNNGYTLIVGRFGSFGYEVEPKIAVVLNPPEDRIYTMYSIPVPNYHPCGYDVNYQASMELREITSQSYQHSSHLFKQQIVIPNLITRVSWTLNLEVKVQFPKFIYKLPSSIIQSTGDRLLGQIIRQISPRLTYKVQQDFHDSHNLPIPPKSSRQLDRVIDISSQNSLSDLV
ncbi:MAG: DUF1997 domain-containing protein [Pleurocapsa sp.]